MSQVFLDYSKYYDVLYQDKDYQKEVDFIVGLIKEYHPDARTILNLGCGTGNHDFLLAKAGYQVTGIDLSEEMIDIAKTKNQGQDCTFIHGDARSLDLGGMFDVVISLFHVLSYQTRNEDVHGFLSTVSTCMKPQGISIFDYWYGPAVLHMKPEKRYKEFDSQDLKVKRHASTEMDYVRNIATVHFDVTVKKKTEPAEIKLKEKHPMRYFFTPELELFYERLGLTHLKHAEWMTTNKDPSENSWAAYSLIKR